MGMTREEAIEILQEEWDFCQEPTYVKNAIQLGIAALRAPPESRWRRSLGGWEGAADGYADGELVYDMWSCSKCGYTIDTDNPDDLPIVCPKCLSPMTNDAVDMMLNRWKEAMDGETKTD